MSSFIVACNAWMTVLDACMHTTTEWVGMCLNYSKLCLCLCFYVLMYNIERDNNRGNITVISSFSEPQPDSKQSTLKWKWMHSKYVSGIFLNCIIQIINMLLKQFNNRSCKIRWDSKLKPAFLREHFSLFLLIVMVLWSAKLLFWCTLTALIIPEYMLQSEKLILPAKLQVKLTTKWWT